jgi:hypothetical protein
MIPRIEIRADGMRFCFESPCNTDWVVEGTEMISVLKSYQKSKKVEFKSLKRFLLAQSTSDLLMTMRAIVGNETVHGFFCLLLIVRACPALRLTISGEKDAHHGR